jgi:hypothetical protein
MKRNRTVKNALFVMIVLTLLTAAANAETTFHAETPGSKVSASQAAKLMKTSHDVWRCRAVHQGPNINPVSISSSPTTWHTAVGHDLGDKALDMMSDGKRVVRCEQVTIDPTSLRVRKIANQ